MGLAAVVSRRLPAVRLAVHHRRRTGEVYGRWGSIFKAIRAFLACFLSLLKGGPNKGGDAPERGIAKEFEP